MFIILLIALSCVNGSDFLGQSKAETFLETLATQQNCFLAPKGQQFKQIDAKNWNFSNTQAQSVDFQASGQDIYFGIFPTNQNVSKFSYGIVLGGWGNTWTKFYRNGAFDDKWNNICQFNFGVPTQLTTYRVVYTADTCDIILYINGKEAARCHDPIGYKVPKGTAFSFSSYSPDVNVCNISVGPWNNLPGPTPVVVVPPPAPKPAPVVTPIVAPPAPVKPAPTPAPAPAPTPAPVPAPPAQPTCTALQRRKWTMNQAWAIPANGNGQFSFTTKGTDIYIGLFDTLKQENSFTYSIVIGGWQNAGIKVFKGQDWENALCEVDGGVDDPTADTNYQVIVDASVTSIAVYTDGTEVINCQDDAWAGNNVKFFSFSQNKVPLSICNIVAEAASWPVTDDDSDSDATDDSDDSDDSDDDTDPDVDEEDDSSDDDADSS